MRWFIICSLLTAALLITVPSTCFGQYGVTVPTYGWRYGVYYPGASVYYPGHSAVGPYNEPYLSTTSRDFTTRPYYDPIPYGSSWYSGYGGSTSVYSGGHSYNYQPYYNRRW